MKSSESETVLLKDKIKFAESFVKLQTTRYEGGMFVNFNVPEEAMLLKIVPVTLQKMQNTLHGLLS